MNKQQVTSSNIESVGYDSDEQTMEVTFLNGATYQYFDVPEEIFTSMINADSVGSYFAKTVKGTYRFSKV